MFTLFSMVYSKTLTRRVLLKQIGRKLIKNVVPPNKAKDVFKKIDVQIQKMVYKELNSKL